jgi:hypothetical protein
MGAQDLAVWLGEERLQASSQKSAYSRSLLPL